MVEIKEKSKCVLRKNADKNRVKVKPDVRDKAVEHGLSFLFDEELIMLILGNGAKHFPVEVISEKILDVIDESEPEELVEKLLKLKGVGKSKALSVAASIELGRRRNNHLRAPIRRPEDIVPFVRSYAVNVKEHFLLVTLNGGHEIIQIHVVSVGTLNRTLIHPREVFSLAIKDNAAALILCHNHPSGNCNPSEDDVMLTKNLLDVAQLMRIEILDHVIVSRENYFSFLENKLLFYSDEKEKKPLLEEEVVQMAPEEKSSDSGSGYGINEFAAEMEEYSDFEKY